MPKMKMVHHINQTWNSMLRPHYAFVPLRDPHSTSPLCRGTCFKS